MLRLEKEHQDKAQDVDQGKDDHKDSLINFTNDNNLAIGMILMLIVIIMQIVLDLRSKEGD